MKRRDRVCIFRTESWSLKIRRLRTRSPGCDRQQIACSDLYCAPRKHGTKKDIAGGFILTILTILTICMQLSCVLLYGLPKVHMSVPLCPHADQPGVLHLPTSSGQAVHVRTSRCSPIISCGFCSRYRPLYSYAPFLASFAFLKGMLAIPVRYKRTGGDCQSMMKHKEKSIRHRQDYRY